MIESIVRHVLKARLEFLGIALILYAAIAVKGELLADKGDELFPFFTWSLFSYPEKIRTNYWIYVADKNDAGKLVEINITSVRDTIRFNKAVSRMGSLFQKFGANSDTFQDQRQSVENFLRALDIKEYVFVRRTYEVMEYYRDRSVLKVEPVARFSVAESMK